MIHILFTTPLGAKVSVPIDRPEQLFPTLRRYGQLGWVSGDVPAGGLRLPLADEPEFDFSLIGARPYVNAQHERCVMHGGMSYKRRELEESESRKLGKLEKMVKYSRGARRTDLPHLKEGEDIQYVTLITFKGGGRQHEQYAVPRQPRNAAD